MLSSIDAVLLPILSVERSGFLAADFFCCGYMYCTERKRQSLAELNQQASELKAASETITTRTEEKSKEMAAIDAVSVDQTRGIARRAPMVSLEGVLRA